MPLQNSTNGTTVLYKSPITGTFGNTQVPSYNGSAFTPGSGGGGVWGSITGTLSSQTDLQTALNGKQTTITTGTTAQYFRGNLSLSTFSTDALAVLLTGLSSSSATIAATDSIITAFGKTLGGLAAVNTRIDNLAPPNTGFFNGGDNASALRILGNTTNFGLNVITNNLARIKITGGGLVNVTNGNEYAVANNFVQPGSFVISGRNNSYGGGTGGWSSNTAQLILEFITNTEFAGEVSGVGLTSFFYYEQNATTPNRRLVLGRDMGHGRTQMIRTASNSLLHAHTDFSFSSFSSYLTDGTRPNVIIGGNYPHLFLVSQGTGSGSTTNAIKLATVGSDTTHRHLNEGQRNDGKYYSIAYYEGTDYNPHNNLGSSTGTIQYVMPGYSTNNNLSTGIGTGINTDAASILYNLHIRGTDNTNGTIGWGLNEGSRTEIKNDASSTDRIGKQSGFYRTTAPVNYFTGASTDATFLIDCRYDNPIYGLQIAGNYNDDNLWTRKVGRSWYRILTTLNGWTRGGNDLSANSENKIGSTSGHDVIFIANNIEYFRLTSGIARSIQVDTSTYGTASNPNYAFRGNFGENNGMYYSASGKLSFSTNSTERLQIDNANNINAYLPINLAGSTQEVKMGGTRVLGTRKAALTVANSSAISTTTYDATVAAVINNLRTRINELEDRLASINGHGLMT